MSLGRISIVSAALVAGVICGCNRRYSENEARQYITESERQWAESVATGQTGDVERIVADDFVGIDTHGKTYDKAQMIADTRKGPEYFVSNHLNNVEIRFYGNTVAQGSESWEKRNGDRGRFVWTDTWLRRNGRWQIVAAEDLTVSEGKP
jgi:uncharacterized protein DUF4440